MYVFHIVDWFVAILAMFVFCIFECLVMTWVYGTSSTSMPQSCVSVQENRCLTLLKRHNLHLNLKPIIIFLFQKTVHYASSSILRQRCTITISRKFTGRHRNFCTAFPFSSISGHKRMYDDIFTMIGKKPFRYFLVPIWGCVLPTLLVVSGGRKVQVEAI